jgi:hypothetical protein
MAFSFCRRENLLKKKDGVSEEIWGLEGMGR